jgi:6-methylsalicylate decarboxylase
MMQGGEVSRRQVLGMLSAMGASAALGSGAALAQNAAPVPAIDTHHHIYPPAYVAANLKRLLADSVALPASAYQSWTPAVSLDQMDKSGVAAAVVSMTSPGVWWGDNKAGLHWARVCNDYGASLVKDHPGRFGMFAATPLPDTAGSLKEIAYALDTLKLDGIGLLTSYKGKLLGDAAFARVMDELNHRKAVVFVHPTMSCCGNVFPGISGPTIEFPVDTVRTITSLLVTGTLARCPDIKFIFSHGGGPLAMINSRITGVVDRMPAEERARIAPDGAMKMLQKLHYDVAGIANPPAMAGLMKLVPLTQITYGSDAPFGSSLAISQGLVRVGLSQDELRAIRRDNALRLLPRFAA